MINYDLIVKRWNDFVSVATAGSGPWEVQHDRTLGWCVKKPRETGTRPVVLPTRTEAVAVCAALNAVSSRS